MVSPDIQTTVPSSAHCEGNVVEQLFKTNLRLQETESNLTMLSRMLRTGIPTNDVRSFARKQVACKKSGSQSINMRIIKTSMRSKLVDVNI